MQCMYSACGSSGIAKHNCRKNTMLEYERPEVGRVEVEAAIAQANIWIRQWHKVMQDTSPIFHTP